MLKQKTNSTIVKFYRGFSDETRLSILKTLVGGEKTVSQIVGLTKQSQSNISNHLKCLGGCGLVNKRRVGKNIIYFISDKDINKLLILTDNIVTKIGMEIDTCQNFTNKYETKHN